MKFVELSEKEFRGFESKNPQGNIMQTVERARLREEMGYATYLVGLKDKDEIKAAGLIVERNGEGWMQLGPILDWGEIGVVKKFLEGYLEFAKKKNFIEIEVFPPVLLSVRSVKGEKLKEFDRAKLFGIFKNLGFAHMGMTTKIEYKANRWMCVKDLREIDTIDEARATYKKNVRNKLRKVSKELEVHVLTKKEELREWIKALESSNQKNKVHSSRGVWYYEQIWDKYGNDVQFMVVRKKDDKDIVSSRVVFYRPNEVVTFVSGTVQKYKKLNGMTVMQDWQIGECLKRGIKRLNFYGMEGDFSENNRLLEFKSGFGVEVEEYIGGFRYVLRPVRYNLQRLKRKIRTLICAK